MRLTITGTVDLSPDCTTPDTGEPAGTHNGQSYWTWTNDAGTWYLWASINPKGGKIYCWYITTQLGTKTSPRWEGPIQVSVPGVYARYPVIMGQNATVAEYVPPVAAVVTNILLGSTPDTCQILNSRIVRGAL
jgi:hypothetical protein